MQEFFYHHTNLSRLTLQEGGWWWMAIFCLVGSLSTMDIETGRCVFFRYLMQFNWTHRKKCQTFLKGLEKFKVRNHKCNVCILKPFCQRYTMHIISVCLFLFNFTFQDLHVGAKHVGQLFLIGISQAQNKYVLYRSFPWWSTSDTSNLMKYLDLKSLRDYIRFVFFLKKSIARVGSFATTRPIWWML